LLRGKGAVSNILKHELGYEIYRNGEYMRNLAKQRNETLEEFLKYVTKHPHIDMEIENRLAGYVKKHKNLIIDGRLAFYIVPSAFKVYLTVDEDVAAKRAFNDATRKGIEEYKDIEEYKKAINKRFENENKRYKRLYNVDKTDMSHYDLVIDTTKISALDVSKKILKAYKKWQQE